jgi:glutaconate CoA-transferase subunit B
MLACLLAKQAYDWDFVYINVAGGVDPRPSHVPLSSSDPVLAEHSASIFANEDFYDLCTRGRMDLTFLGAAQIDGSGCANNSSIGDWHRPKVRLPGGGGGAVMLPTARRACTWRTEHSTRTFVKKLDFRTSWGGHQTRRTARPAILASRIQPGRSARPDGLRVRRHRCHGDGTADGGGTARAACPGPGRTV